MSDEEKLQRIKSRCEKLLAGGEGSLLARAGWLATIAAIEAIEESSHTTGHWHAIHKVSMNRILTAWEGLV